MKVNKTISIPFKSLDKFIHVIQTKKGNSLHIPSISKDIDTDNGEIHVGVWKIKQRHDRPS